MFKYCVSLDLLGSKLPLTAELYEIILEYCHLAAVKYLSEAEANRLAEILNIAQESHTVDFWITEVDRFIGQKLNLINEDEFKNKQAKLREYFGVERTITRQMGLMN